MDFRAQISVSLASQASTLTALCPRIIMAKPSLKISPTNRIWFSSMVDMEGLQVLSTRMLVVEVIITTRLSLTRMRTERINIFPQNII